MVRSFFKRVYHVRVEFYKKVGFSVCLEGKTPLVVAGLDKCF